MVNIFFHELRTYRKPTIIWAGSLSALTIIFLTMYPSFTKDVAASKEILGSLPQAIRDAFGISLQNFFTIFGFFGYLLNFIVLAAAVQAMNLGVGIISKEESGKTADFLLTKPISRAAVITNKLLAAFTLLLATNIVLAAVAFFGAKSVSIETFDNKIFVLMLASIFLVQLAFLALGTLFSVLIPKIKSVISVSLPTVFAFYIIGTLGAILGNENVKYVTPFKFYDSDYIISHGNYETKFLILEAILVIVTIITSYIIFIKKDIRAAS